LSLFWDVDLELALRDSAFYWGIGIFGVNIGAWVTATLPR
jgi:hypothetical protein